MNKLMIYESLTKHKINTICLHFEAGFDIFRYLKSDHILSLIIKLKLENFINIFKHINTESSFNNARI